jgi:hypothetical protein
MSLAVACVPPPSLQGKGWHNVEASVTTCCRAFSTGPPLNSNPVKYEGLNVLAVLGALLHTVFVLVF